MVNDAPSRKANCKMLIVENCGDGQPHLCLFATKDIAVGDERRFDYGVKNLPWRKVCVQGMNFII